MNTETRNVRKPVFESLSDDDSYFQAECDLTTTYIDSNVTCSRSSTAAFHAAHLGVSVARPEYAALRPSRSTVTGPSSISVFFTDVQSILQLLTGLFPYAQLASGVQPVVAYIIDPYEPLANSRSTIDVDRSTFEIRLAQILNTVLYLGISPVAFTGAFDASNPEQQANVLNIMVIRIPKISTGWVFHNIQLTGMVAQW